MKVTYEKFYGIVKTLIYLIKVVIVFYSLNFARALNGNKNLYE